MPIIELAEYGPDFLADPYPYYAKLREEGPVHEVRAPDGYRFWLIVGYAEGRSALTDSRLVKARDTMATSEASPLGKHVLIADPPDHTRLRKLISREFTVRRVDNLRPRIQELTDDLLDAMLPAGRADLVEALARPLPIAVLCELLGVPNADRDEFHSWAKGILAPQNPTETHTAVKALMSYLDDLIEDKRRGEPTGDLLSGLIRTSIENGDRLSSEEVRSTAFLLMIAGHETTANLISNGTRALLTHRDQLDLLRSDMDLLDGAVEEMLRYDGSLESTTKRFTSVPVQIGDTVIPPGETVLVSLASADRDPANFDDPDRFDIRRGTPAGVGHLAFGHGIHYCLGASLARAEGRIAFRALLERCPDLELDPEAPPFEWMPGVLVRGVQRLSLRW
ncbi:cytochrome P450 [Streptomyces populi]|uniref:Cytochrome P450 n=1 Tax=Streptomyces populi TaxID=2058924 RepID=A0A2I0SCC8_9ACTN|nr:cytochrome P450 [Streptomyces populi]PKT67607.1 cytochrome P450 [Streptomyces populi]